jgi:hypothetical protein
MNKEEFRNKFLQDQDRKKRTKRKKSILPFKEETYLDLINLFREKWGNDIEVEKKKEVILKYKWETFNIKIITKRNRVNL